ncbi:MAG TPA: SDR family oxidoreductase [Polyangia bacterium]|jgi:3-oxoacyl-[acyl-carrier protein] reductase|nr:SDR family oxidoreductase [Polyangia bacterium]
MAREALLLTGASSDLGLALIRRLLSRPEAPLVLAHHRAGGGGERLQALQREFGAERIQLCAADFGDPAAAAALGDRIAAQHETPTQFVHLPALKLVYERFTKFDWARFEADLTIQVRVAVTLLQRFAPQMAKRPAARVVFVLSSVTRGVPPRFLSMYTVVKHAQLGLMKALASEYAGTGLTINAVSPSMVGTRFLDDIPEVARDLAAAQSPAGRHATPDEVVGAIAFLLSAEAGYINGAELPITAGAAF